MILKIFPGIIRQDKQIRENGGAFPGSGPVPLLKPVMGIRPTTDSGTKGDFSTNIDPFYIHISNLDPRATKIELHGSAGKIGDFVKDGNATYIEMANPQDDSTDEVKVIVGAAGLDDVESNTRTLTYEAPVPALSMPVLSITNDSDSGTKGDFTTNVTPVTLHLGNVDEAATRVELHGPNGLIGNFSFESNTGYTYQLVNPRDDSSIDLYAVVGADGYTDTQTETKTLTFESLPTNSLKFTGYAATWGHGAEIGTSTSKFQQLDNTDVQTVLYAFIDGLNDGTDPRTFTVADSTQANVMGMDFGPAITFKNVKDDIAAMKANNIEAYFSVGGATYTSTLPMIEAEGEYIINNPSTVKGDSNVPILNKLIDIVEYFDLAGLDVDWEDLTVFPTSIDYAWRLYTFTKGLRWAIDQASGTRKLAIASFSTAWDNTALTNAGTADTIAADHGLVSAWGGNAGQARCASKFTYGGTTYTDFLDCFDSIYIMSYDVGDLVATADGSWAGTGDKYSAVQAYQDCIQVQKAMGKTIPVYMGIEPPPEGAGLSRMVVKTAHATGEESILRADQYSRSVDIPHAVEYYAEYMKTQSQGSDASYAGGLMMWALWKAAPGTGGDSGGTTNTDGHAYATDLTAIAEVKRVWNA